MSVCTHHAHFASNIRALFFRTRISQIHAHHMDEYVRCLTADCWALRWVLRVCVFWWFPSELCVFSILYTQINFPWATVNYTNKSTIRVQSARLVCFRRTLWAWLCVCVCVCICFCTHSTAVTRVIASKTIFMLNWMKSTWFVALSVHTSCGQQLGTALLPIAKHTNSPKILSVFMINAITLDSCDSMSFWPKINAFSTIPIFTVWIYGIQLRRWFIARSRRKKSYQTRSAWFSYIWIRFSSF